MVLGCDHGAAAGARSRGIAGADGRGILAPHFREGVFEAFERILADAPHQRGQRNAGLAQEPAQVAFAHRGERTQQFVEIGFGDAAGAARFNVSAQRFPFAFAAPA